MILLGDHHQLPPVVQDLALAHACGFDQSLFTRLIRLNVPCVQLDAQGRCRASLASLFAWRYAGLRNLPMSLPRANACLRYVCQMINVEDYNQQGEVMTASHSYTNEGEAEYVVAFYEYLRLAGYPAEKITILCAYNGQRELVASLVKARCKKNPLFGAPRKVTTIDKYQGQQNDIVVLSLTRTRSVGYLGDVRRLLVGGRVARQAGSVRVLSRQAVPGVRGAEADYGCVAGATDEAGAGGERVLPVRAEGGGGGGEELRGEGDEGS